MQPTPPNILLIMADQVVPFLTSPYGDPVARTPNMQRLADEGVRFDAAYTPAPLCAPARASLVTGRDASGIGCFDNASVLPADVPTVGHYLTNAGFETVISGKMHFIGPDQLHGFRRRLTTDVLPAGLDWVPVVDEHGRFPAGGHARHYADPDPGVRTWTQFMDFDEETQHRALQYLRERGRTGASQPFGLVVSFHHPHDPFHVRQEYWDRYEGIEPPTSSWPEGIAQSAMDRWANEAHETADYDLRDPDSLRRLRRGYYAALSYVDDKIGELLEALRESGELQNTVVIFTSDHGDMMTERGMVQKRTFYEWSARVPLTVTFPDGRSAGSTVGTPVSLIDLLPTLLDIVGVPEDARARLDGRSLLPMIDGDEGGEQRPVFSEYHLEKVWSPCFMVRRGRYKYVYVHGHDRQLFDLETDPHEWTDLSDRPEHAPVVDELHEALTARFDPEQLAAAGAETIPRRVIVAEAMRRNDQRWDYTPVVDGTRQYIR